MCWPAASRARALWALLAALRRVVRAPGPGSQATTELAFQQFAASFCMQFLPCTGFPPNWPTAGLQVFAHSKRWPGGAFAVSGPLRTRMHSRVVENGETGSTHNGRTRCHSTPETSRATRNIEYNVRKRPLNAVHRPWARRPQRNCGDAVWARRRARRPNTDTRRPTRPAPPSPHIGVHAAPAAGARSGVELLIGLGHRRAELGG